VDAIMQSESFMTARLIDSRWLDRSIEVSLADGVHVVAYNGWGFHYEQVSFDGDVIRKTSLLWFVPRFEFTLSGLPCVLEVHVWPWFALRSFVLRVGDRVVYGEATDRLDTRRSRVQFTVRGMMIAVAVVAFACFFHEHLLVGYVTQCYGGRIVPIEFLVIDAETGAPVPHSKLTLSGRGSQNHSLKTGPDGRALLTFQTGCEERTYLLWGNLYTVHYSNWKLGIEAQGYESIQAKLDSYRRDTRYPGDAVPPPIPIRIRKQHVKL
jgi:hypothetical protein